MVKVIVSVTSHPSGACFIYRYITKYQCMLSVLTIQLKQSIFPKACLPSIGKQGHFIYLYRRFRKNLCTFSENLYKQIFFCTKNNQNLFIFKYQDDKNYSKDDIIR